MLFDSERRLAELQEVQKTIPYIKLFLHLVEAVVFTLG